MAIIYFFCCLLGVLSACALSLLLYKKSAIKPIQITEKGKPSCKSDSDILAIPSAIQKDSKLQQQQLLRQSNDLWITNSVGFFR